jgi:hypothetical protein
MPRGYQAPTGKFNNRQKDISRVLREKFDRMKGGYKVPGTAHDQRMPGKPVVPEPDAGTGEKPCGDKGP